MHYTIISCSPQNKSRSTSAVIAEVTKATLTKNTDDVADIFYLNDRSKWNETLEAFYQGENIIFVLPLYVEGIPGLLLEFLQKTEPSHKRKGSMAFILQGGFEEASQLRTAEEYLSTIPTYYNCEYSGTLIKGGMFGMATMRGEKFRKESCKEFSEMIKQFKQSNAFLKDETKQFTGAEYYSKGMIFLSKFTKPLNRLIWRIMGKKMGLKEPITLRPYLS